MKRSNQRVEFCKLKSGYVGWEEGGVDTVDGNYGKCYEPVPLLFELFLNYLGIYTRFCINVKKDVTSHSTLKVVMDPFSTITCET